MARNDTRLEPAPPIPPATALRTVARVARFVRPYRRQVIVAAIALVVAAAAVLLFGQGLKYVIDRGFSANDARQLDRMLALSLGVIVLLAFATYTRFYFVSWIGERVTADLRRAVFDHLMSLPPSFFEAARTGEVMSRLTNDTTMLEQVIGSSASMAVRNFLLMIGGIAMMLATSVKLTLLVMVGIPVVVAPIVLFGRKVRKLARASQDRVGDVSSYLDEALHEIRVVQAYGHEDQDRRLFGERVEAAFTTATQRIRQRAFLVACVITLVFGAVGVILWVGGHDVISGAMSAGQLSAFVFYAVLVASAVGTISEVIGDLQRAAGATERLFELLAVEPAIRTPADPQALPTPSAGSVAFDRVTFHYPARPEHAALADFTLDVRRGEKVALVGPSGAGKTTVLQLLMRFYDAGAGRIRVDGVDVARADPREVRRRFALVPQDPVMFAASVAENVRFGRPQASDDEVRAACVAAYADAFVERLPQGYGTFLGERGVRLSGGQRQRLAIARAVLADRPFLLLDEATSALDAESEREVQLALETLMTGRTVLMIAHRLATIRHADRIAVMEEGRIIAVGTHDGLLRASPLYARLAALQFLDK
ncbi:MAG TPA: ABC transporter transmembrane domain-containing protein [Casimicrobiaceae bacterium]|jgi:ATP-binding cassette subfamily B protein|nr:ABC transporter transmembrane domain-containing protein [Casimicrobiaceae bacterium]